MAPSDWHTEDIKAAIRKTRITLHQLALDHGLNPTAITVGLRQPWPRVEAIIAARLGKRPQDIWPSRYADDGAPIHGRPNATNHNTRQIGAQRQKREAA